MTRPDHRKYRTSFLPSLLCLSCLVDGVLGGSAVSAQERDLPVCGVTATPAASAALATGDRLVRRDFRISGRTGAHDPALLEAALASYDDACVAGEVTALERRATVLARLERPLEAIRSLDAFLARRPLATLDPRLRERVAANLTRLEERVATLDLTLTPEDAVVSVDGHVEVGRVRTAVGTHVLRVSAPTFVPHEETLEVHAGAQALTITLEALVSVVGVGAVSAIPESQATAEAAPSGSEGASRDGRVVVRDLHDADELEAPMVASFVVGALALGGAVASSLWAVSSWRAYTDCTEAGRPCGGLADERLLSLGLAIGAGASGLIALGVGLGLAVESGSRRAGYRSWRCGVGGLSITCSVTF
jgi:hypothetical protein